MEGTSGTGEILQVHEGSAYSNNGYEKRSKDKETSIDETKNPSSGMTGVQPFTRLYPFLLESIEGPVETEVAVHVDAQKH